MKRIASGFLKNVTRILKMSVVPDYLMKPILVAMLNALVDAEYLGITSVIMLIDLMHINNVRKVTQ